MTERCELIEFLRAPGPERVPLRACCVFSLLDHGENVPGCVLEREPVPAFAPAVESEPVP
jgi:hypothetical protein